MDKKASYKISIDSRLVRGVKISTDQSLNRLSRGSEVNHLCHGGAGVVALLIKYGLLGENLSGLSLSRVYGEKSYSNLIRLNSNFRTLIENYPPHLYNQHFTMSLLKSILKKGLPLK